MNSQFEFHFPAHRCLAKDGFDVEQAQPAHLKQILKKRRAAPFNEIRTEQRKIDGIIRDEAVAAADQFKPQLALPRPDSPASRTPMPRISRNTPCRVVRGAKMREIKERRRSITVAAGSGVVNSGVDERVHLNTRSAGASMPPATTRNGGSSAISPAI